MICFEQKCSNDHKFFLISESGLVGKKIIGRCHKPELNPGGGCLFVSAYRGKRISYIFRTSELPRWREIDAHVHTLLDSFVVEEDDR